MKSERDPMGKAILDYVNKVNTSDISVESNITLDEAIEVQYLFRSWEQMPPKEQFALTHAQGRILDVGAGSGAHALALEKLGKDVVALDHSLYCCKAMKKQGVKQIVHADFFQFEDQEQFDTILFMMNGFGIAGTLSDLTILLEKSKSLLKPGGILMGESADIAYMYEGEEEVNIDMEESYYGELTYRMHYENKRSSWFPWLYVSKDILVEKAQEVGFKVIDYFDGEDHDYMIRLQLL